MGRLSKRAREFYEQASKLDEEHLQAFEELDEETQRQIVELTREPANNPKVAKAERELAETRAQQYEARMKKSGKRRRKE